MLDQFVAGEGASRMKPGALPLYQQISELLIRDIAAGRLIEGERLPPERIMAAQMGVAVGTLRQALKDMTEKGLLVRVQGSGNYVRARADAEAVYAFFRLELLEGSGLPTATVLSVDRVSKDPVLPSFGTDTEGHRIRRLRFLSGAPAAVEEIWLDGSYAPRIDPGDLSESLYLYYRTRLGLRIQRAEDRVGQGPLPHWSPPAFPHAAGTLLPEVIRISWGQGGDRAEVSRSWYDPARVSYVARIR